MDISFFSLPPVSFKPRKAGWCASTLGKKWKWHTLTYRLLQIHRLSFCAGVHRGGQESEWGRRGVVGARIVFTSGCVMLSIKARRTAARRNSQHAGSGAAAWSFSFLWSSTGDEQESCYKEHENIKEGDCKYLHIWHFQMVIIIFKKKWTKDFADQTVKAVPIGSLIFLDNFVSFPSKSLIETKSYF